MAGPVLVFSNKVRRRPAFRKGIRIFPLDLDGFGVARGLF